MSATQSWRRLVIGTCAFLCLLQACKSSNDSSTVELAQLNKSQSQADFNALVATFQSLYGPVLYKQQRFQFNYDDLVSTYQAKIADSTGDVDTYGALKQFLASFHDGHVNIAFQGNATGVETYDLGIFVTPLEGRTIVADVYQNAPDVWNKVQVGDELLAIDGTDPKQLLPTILKYDVMATDLSNQHLIALTTRRPFYIKELVPAADTATLTLAHPDNTQYQVVAHWTKMPTFDQTIVNIPAKNTITNGTARKLFQIFETANGKATLAQMGDPTPFFATKQVLSTYNFVPVTLSQDYMTKYHLADSTNLPVGYTYTVQGKTVLLLRQPTYDTGTAAPDDFLNAYRAIMDRYQNYVDVLVLDQTHNPGGSIEYAENFFQLFLNSTVNNQVEHLHVDRKWVYDLQSQATAEAQSLSGGPQAAGADMNTNNSQLSASVSLLTSMANDVDNLTTTSTVLTPMPYPISGFNTIDPDKTFAWKKPMLVLADELAGSCGDIFPMLIQRNQIAKVFGQPTMGLGGNVDDNAITLPYSQATVDVTRGLYTTYRPDGAYSDADLVENNGITPDIPYTHTVADFRAGFVSYVQTFSAAALAQIPSGAPSAQPMPADFNAPSTSTPQQPPTAPNLPPPSSPQSFPPLAPTSAPGVPPTSPQIAPPTPPSSDGLPPPASAQGPSLAPT